MSSLIAGKYEVLETLGESAAGTTYKVRHTLLDSILTLTVLPDDLARDTERLGRVQRAVRGAFDLKHERIVRVLDLGCEADRYHLVEAAVEADPLERVLRERGCLSASDALQLAWQLADALAYAHERGMVHGALTPASVLVERAAVPRVLVSGFVVAEVARAENGLPAALAAYTAPERVAPAGDAKPDPRSDVFTLGLLLFEMLEGKAFFAGKSEAEIAGMLADTSAPLLPRFSRIAPSGVPAVVARAIRRPPAERQQGMAQMRREIDACLQRLDRSPGDTPVTVAAAAPSVAVAPDEPGAPARPTHVAPSPPRPEPVEPAAVKVRPTRERPVVGSAAIDRPLPTVAPGEQGMSAERIVARRLLEAAGVKPGARRRMPVASGALVLAVLVLGWVVFRPTRKAPAAPASAPVAAERVLPQVASTAVAAPAPTSEPGSTPPAVPAPPAAVPVAAVEEISSPPPVLATTVALANRPEEPARRPERAVPPRIASARPGAGGPVNVLEGAAVDFSVTTTDVPTGTRLDYAWYLDGERVSRRPSWRFVAPRAANGTTHRVEVQVADAGGLKAPPLSWSVEVSPRMSEADVREWLARLAAAWERTDVATLRLFGIVTSDAQADEVRRWVSRHDGYHVSFRAQALRTEGPYATVAVDRVDADARGKTVSSRQESYELEKRASGFIALRAR